MTREERRKRGNASSRAWYARNKEKCRVARAIDYAEHREERKARQATYYAEDKKKEGYKAKHAAWQLMYKYGLTQVAFDSLLRGQGSVCAICGKSDWGRGGPNVDHDHVTGVVRGILCNYCNTALGMIKDNLKTSRAMSGYIEGWTI